MSQFMEGNGVENNNLPKESVAMWNFIWYVLIGVIMISAIVVFLQRTRNPQDSHRDQDARGANVVKFQRKPEKAPKTQKCSFCKKEEKLTFYAGDNGQIWGVCKNCKPQAERRDMLPL